MKKKSKKNQNQPKAPRPTAGGGRPRAGAGITPLADRVLVKPLSADDTEVRRPSGIIIPETVDKERPQEGTVIAVGKGKYDDGKLNPVSVKTGDRVMFSKYGGDEVKIDGVGYIILREDQILAVIN